VIGPTPLLDFFKRGEVAHDVRQLAARGALSLRPYEQLAILALLREDHDPEVARTAESTLQRIPADTLKRFLGRPDTPASLRQFFEARGIRPERIEPGEADEDLDVLLAVTEQVEGEPSAEAAEDDQRKSTIHKLAEMSFTERLKAALSGGREVRAILIRDTNKMISATVLSNPRVSDQEVESFARMPNVPEEILRMIASTRAWLKHYGVVVALVKNPKTPIALSLNLMPRLVDRDLAMLSIDRNIPDTLRVAARRKVVDSPGRR
jgi:hypothetical protein